MNYAWWATPLIPAPERQKQENEQFWVNLGYIVGLRLIWFLSSLLPLGFGLTLKENKHRKRFNEVDHLCKEVLVKLGLKSDVSSKRLRTVN